MMANYLCCHLETNTAMYVMMMLRHSSVREIKHIQPFANLLLKTELGLLIDNLCGLRTETLMAKYFSFHLELNAAHICYVGVEVWCCNGQ